MKKNIIPMFAGILIIVMACITWVFLDNQPSKKDELLRTLRIQQSQADQTIQYSKPTIYKACTDYKQAQIDRDNLETRITTIVNSKYTETIKQPKLKTMNVDKFCKDFINNMSRKFYFTQEQQLQKLSSPNKVDEKQRQELLKNEE